MREIKAQACTVLKKQHMYYTCILYEEEEGEEKKDEQNRILPGCRLLSWRCFRQYTDILVGQGNAQK